jgi:diacylglycerol O-acyltransferase
MSALDASFLYLERPHAPLAIGCVIVLEGPLTIPEVLRHFETRLGQIPRLSQRAVPAPLSLSHPAWEADPHFDLRNHVHRGAIPAPGGEPELCEQVAETLARPLERTRPLWDAQLFEGLHGGRSALVQRAHHCVVDGVAGIGILEALLDAERAPAQPVHSGAPRTGSPVRPLQRLGRALAASTADNVQHSLEVLGALRHPVDLAHSLAPIQEVTAWTLRRMIEGPTALPWNGAIGPRRRLAFARLGLDDARAIRRARGGTVNDVVLTVLAGGLRRYLRSAEVDPRGVRMHATVPVNVRTAGERDVFGNRIAALLVPLALAPEEETERLAATAATTRRLKQAGGSSGVATLLAAADHLPAPLVAWAARHVRIPAVAGVIATNVRGPDQPRYLAGQRVEALYPIVPVTDGLGLGLAVLSYAGILHVGLNADADRVHDLDELRAGVEESFARLRSSA